MILQNFVILLVVVSGGLCHAQGGDSAAGKAKAATCFACHGNNGNSTNPMYPPLAGKEEAFLFGRLQAYKKGQVKTPNAAMMKPMADTLSEKDMKDLAAFFSSQTPVDPAAGKRRRR